MAAVDIIQTLFSLRDSSHLTHLKAKDYSTHLIFGELYDSLSEDIDRVAELWLSYNQDISLTAVGVNYLSTEDVARYRDMIHTYVNTVVKHKLDKEDLKTALFDTVEHISKAVYLLGLQDGKYNEG